MKYNDGYVQIYNGNSLEVLKTLPEESVQCCVTSPPYWGLRKYDGEQEIVWGGDSECRHEWQMGITGLLNENRQGLSTGIVGGLKELHGKGESPMATCQLCGAWRGAFGLEPTPELYVEHTVEFLREIRRVLRKDGVVFLNIGDSYSGSGGPGNQYDNKHPGMGKHFEKYANPNRSVSTLKPKDLCLIPFRVAIAAQADGWYVRSDIIWSKPNPMPESVKDRPTNSHEYIFMFTKSSKYYWDIDAVREPQQLSSLMRATRGWDGDTDRGYPNGPQSHIDKYFNKAYDEAMSLPGRNIRSVWEFPTQPYPEAHFAVFPTELPKRCIMAASKESDIILDPFSGSGTVGEVAKSLGRKAILIDASEKYCQLAIKRVQSISIPMRLDA